MKKILLIYSLACLTTAAQAQVKIGTNPGTIDPSSVLELEGTNKAFYINRVALLSNTDVVTVPAPKAGMMVYNTNAGMTGGTGTGLYYFNGATWVSTNAAAVASGLSWLLLGNAGTVDGVNFIGTTDNVPFNIRVNNVKSGRIEGTPSYNSSYGYGAFVSNTTGVENVVVGAFSMQNNTTGRKNSSLGYDALGANTTGDSNTALGFGALQVNTTGFNNTASGAYSLNHNTIGKYNTGIGYEALLANVSDSGNTAVGAYALYNSNGGKGNTSMGLGSGFNVTTGDSNTFVGSGAGGLTTTGSNNTYLGLNANGLGINLRWTGAVGSQAIVTVNNGLVLGATDAGSGASNSLPSALPFNSSFVGINETDPTQRIDFRNGHIRNRQDVLPTVGTPLPAGNGVTAAAVAAGSSDVRGRITTVGYNNSNGLTQIRVNFQYQSTNPPIVHITPANESASTTTYYVTSDTQGFDIFFRNVYTGSNASGPSASFNYWVIE